MFQTFKKFIYQNYIAIFIFIFAVLGFVAAFTLSLDKLDILKNPDQALPCNVNSVFNCGIVMRSKYAEFNGIPWSFLGIAGYPAVMLLALVYIEKKKLSIWLTWLTTLPAFGAFVLSTYFMFVSAYLIGVFCPWCIASAISSTVIFFGVITHNLIHKNYGIKEPLAGFISRKTELGFAIPFVVIWFILMGILEYLPFWIN